MATLNKGTLRLMRKAKRGLEDAAFPKWYKDFL
jgi:hypothetical protein